MLLEIRLFAQTHAALKLPVGFLSGLAFSVRREIDCHNESLPFLDPTRETF